MFEKDDNKWSEASSFIQSEASSTIKEKYVPAISKIYDYIGIGSYNIKNKKEEYVFKIKETYNKRAKGTSCKTMYKNDLIELLNTHFSDYKFLGTIRELQTIHICLLIELLFRYNDYNNVNNKIWFLNPTLCSIFKKFKFLL